MWSNKYVKIPFVDHGRVFEGSDCWGLVRLVYKEELGIILPSYDDYLNTEDRESISTMINAGCDLKDWMEIEKGQEKSFDVLVFRMMGLPMHVGVVIQGGEMIHCQKGCGTHVSDYLNNQEWSRRLLGIYRHAANSNSSVTVSS